MTVKTLLRSLDSPELSEWMAYYRIEDEERKRAMLEAKARAGVTATKARRR